MSRPLSDKIQGSALTDVGLTRSENQDACALFSTKGRALIAIVADGMGGHAGGATASRVAIERLHDQLAPTRDEIDGEMLTSAIVDANACIYEQARAEPDLRGMGTTVVALLFHPDGQAWVAHVGDSRAYRLRGEIFEPLTHDHSVVAELVRKGQLTEEEAETDPRRNEILRSVGAAPSVEVEVSPVSVRPGDRFLLCSDGLTGPVGTADISSILALYDPEDATRTLVARANEVGSPDNVTAVALHYLDPNSETDTHTVTSIPETTASEFDLIAVEHAETRRARARRLGIWAAIVGICLVVSIIAVLASDSLTTQARSVSTRPPPTEPIQTGTLPPSTSDQATEPLPYELERQAR